MGLYYIHRVNHQEMGSVKHPGDKPSRGRYFLISKRCLDFFPHLSSVVMNDKIVLTIISMKEEGEKRVLCTMDYHNQRYADITYTGAHPRDEVRLYMNNAIDPNRQYFSKGEFAVFERLKDDDGEVCYSLMRITPEDENYGRIDAMMIEKASWSKGNHLVIEADLDFIPKPGIGREEGIVVSDKAERVMEEEANALLESEEQYADDEVPEAAMGCSFFNNALFRALVMNAYEYRCAITGRVIRYKDFYNLEAAHIKPQAHKGTFLPCNGIAMCRDMHFAFDKGFFTISDDYRVVVSEELKESWFYEEYNNRKIFVPVHQFFRPHLAYLKHHRENVFNKFRQIRRQEE